MARDAITSEDSYDPVDDPDRAEFAVLMADGKPRQYGPSEDSVRRAVARMQADGYAYAVGVWDEGRQGYVPEGVS